MRVDVDEHDQEQLELELKLPDWLEELRLDVDRGVVTMSAKAVVHVPGEPRGRVATFDYELELEQLDDLIAALTTLRDRARQRAEVIDVPSSEPFSRDRSSSSSSSRRRRS